jgi:hypothetical protein
MNFLLASYNGKLAMLRESVSKYMARDCRLDNYVVVSDAVKLVRRYLLYELPPRYFR